MTKERKLYKIYVFGNPLLREDSLPLKLLPKLRELFPDFVFQEIDPTENLPETPHLVILDTILNAQEVCVLTDLDSIDLAPRYSLHDLDLSLNLKLMKKLGKIEKTTIIGLPPAITKASALRQLSHIIPTVLSESVSRN